MIASHSPDGSREAFVAQLAADPDSRQAVAYRVWMNQVGVCSHPLIIPYSPLSRHLSSLPVLAGAGGQRYLIPLFHPFV